MHGSFSRSAAAWTRSGATFAGEEKRAVGPQQRLAGENVPSTALHQQCPGLQRSCEGIHDIGGLECVSPPRSVNLFQRTVNSEGDFYKTGIEVNIRQVRRLSS